MKRVLSLLLLSLFQCIVLSQSLGSITKGLANIPSKGLREFDQGSILYSSLQNGIQQLGQVFQIAPFTIYNQAERLRRVSSINWPLKYDDLLLYSMQDQVLDEFAWIRWIFGQRIVIPAIFLSGMVYLHWGQYYEDVASIENKDDGVEESKVDPFVQFLTSHGINSDTASVKAFIPRITAYQRDNLAGQKSKNGIIRRMLSAVQFFTVPLFIIIVGVIVQCILIKASIYYKPNEREGFTYISQYAEPIQYMMQFFMSYILCLPLLTETPVSGVGILGWVLIYYSIRKWIRSRPFSFNQSLCALFGSLLISWINLSPELYLMPLIGYLLYKYYQEHWYPFLSSVKEPWIFAFASHIGNQALMLWCYLLDDLHVVYGFVFGDWCSSLGLKNANARLALPVLQTGAESTFTYFIDFFDYLKKYYKYLQEVSFEVSVLLERGVFHSEFVESTTVNYHYKVNIPEKLFSEALGLLEEHPDNASWIMNPDVWFADRAYHLIHSTALHPIFTARWIMPVFIISLIIYLKWVVPKETDPTKEIFGLANAIENSLLVPSFWNSFRLRKLGYYINKLITVSKDDDSNDPSSTDPKTVWFMLSEMIMPFLYLIPFYPVQHLLLQASMYYIYDQSPVSAAKFVYNFFYPLPFFLTFMISFPLSRSFFDLRPVVSGHWGWFIGSCFWTLAYFILRKAIRNAYLDPRWTLHYHLSSFSIYNEWIEHHVTLRQVLKSPAVHFIVISLFVAYLYADKGGEVPRKGPLVFVTNVWSSLWNSLAPLSFKKIKSLSTENAAHIVYLSVPLWLAGLNLSSLINYYYESTILYWMIIGSTTLIFVKMNLILSSRPRKDSLFMDLCNFLENPKHSMSVSLLKYLYIFICFSMIYSWFYSGSESLFTFKIFGYLWVFMSFDFQFVVGYTIADLFASLGWVGVTHPAIGFQYEFLKLLFVKSSESAALWDYLARPESWINTLARDYA